MPSPVEERVSGPVTSDPDAPLGHGDPGQRGLALDGIIKLVVEGNLAPGDRTSELDLQGRLEEASVAANRTAVRQALAIMFRDGLVGQRPQVGVWVWDVTPDEAAEVIDLRRRIEAPAVHALSSGQGRLYDQVVGARDLLVVKTVDDFVATEARLHAALLRSAGSHVAARSLISWTQRLRIYFRPGREPFDRLRSGLNELYETNNALVDGLVSRGSSIPDIGRYFDRWLDAIRQPEGVAAAATRS